MNAQSTEELKNKRSQLLTEIKENTRRLQSTRKNKAATLSELTLLQQQIRNREELIATLQKEIENTDLSINRTVEVVELLTEDVGRLQDEYTHLIRVAYRARLKRSWLTFLLSSRSFNEAFRRWQYLRQYQRFRSRQAHLIIETKKSLERKLSQLEKRKEEKETLLLTEKEQRYSVGQEKEAQNKLLRKIKHSESTLLADLKKQERAKEELNQAIESAIANEIARIRSEERAKRTTTTVTANHKKETEVSTSVTTKASEASTFASLRGQLPWPMRGDIVKRFGRQPHPTVKGVEISNNGIDIAIKNGTAVKVVAKGVVVSTHFVPGYQNMVLVRHGDYYTVYSNLERVSVSKEEKLSQGQKLGDVSTSGGELHFELWRQKERLNPERWIRK